jgi:uncharacterized protein YsxB (DUF464 family)
VIEAEFRFDMSTDRILGVKISGHAGFDSYGNDLICASVSALLLATVNALEEYVGLDTGVAVENGRTSFSVETQDKLKSIQSQAIVHSLYMALVGMEDEYDDFITVTITEEEQ